MPLDEDSALRLVLEAVDRLGGPRMIHGNPRHPFARNANREFEIEGHQITVRYSEISSPAVAEIDGYVFEIREDEVFKLFGP